MAADSNTLLAEARCYACHTANPYALQLIKLALLRNILLESDPNADVTPQTLLNQARCFECYASSGYMLQLMELALLDQIASA